MSDSISIVVFTREDAHAAAGQAYALAQAIIANGQNALIECRQALEPITILQRKFLHGPVLNQISEQVRVGRERYVTKVWKEYFRSLFLPDEWVPEKRFHRDESGALVPDKRATPRRVRRSTEELGVRAYAEFTEKVIDYATVEWGVVFIFTREEQQLRRPARKETPA